MVEDSIDIQGAVVRTLENLGFHVAVATSEAEALRLIDEQDHLDILLTDVVLADGVAGPVLAGAARSRFPDCSVVFMSGYVDDEVTRLVSDDPDGHYMTKPFTMSALTDNVLGALKEPHGLQAPAGPAGDEE